MKVSNLISLFPVIEIPIMMHVIFTYLFVHLLFLDRRQPGPIKSVLLVIIGWLVDNAVLSETALMIFLVFCTKLGDYKVRKVIEPDFSKNS